MEVPIINILESFTKECTSSKYIMIKQSAISAIGILRTPEGSNNVHLSELREKVLDPLQLALESGHHKLNSLAILGLKVS